MFTSLFVFCGLGWVWEGIRGVWHAGGVLGDMGEHGRDLGESGRRRSGLVWSGRPLVGVWQRLVWSGRGLALVGSGRIWLWSGKGLAGIW
jgi:hypothetical protein